MAARQDVLILCGFLLLVGPKVHTIHAPPYNGSNELLTIFDRSDQILPQVKLSKLVADKIDKREIFYGIEISSNTKSKLVLDYREFKVKPLFTSVVWVGEIYSDFVPIIEASPVKMWKLLHRSTVVLPHLTCYRMNREKLKKLLLPELNNILLLRGDNVDKSQEYKVAVDLIREVRSQRSADDLSIVVAGYPEGHPQAPSKQDDLNFLKEKVEAGADIIITQVCFSSSTILQFIQDCRNVGINVPIIPGIFLPRNYKILEFMVNITKAYPSEEQMLEYKRRENDNEAFLEYANQLGLILVKELFDGGVPGVHFFTTNYFDNVQEIVDKLF